MGISPVGWIFVRSWRGAKLMRELAGANTIYWTLFSKFRNSLNIFVCCVTLVWRFQLSDKNNLSSALSFRTTQYLSPSEWSVATPPTECSSSSPVSFYTARLRDYDCLDHIIPPRHPRRGVDHHSLREVRNALVAARNTGLIFFSYVFAEYAISLPENTLSNPAYR
jgi:hypothetical protein